MVRLLVDDSAGFSQGAGIGRYARNVLPAALKHLADWTTTLFYAAPTRTPEPFQQAALAILPAGANVRTCRVPLPRRRVDQIWFRARLPIPVEFFAGRCDLMYSPDFTAPPTLARNPRMVTVHDLAFLVAPEYAPPGLRSYLSGVVPRQVKGATTVAVVSETTKADVVERLHVDSERIVVIRNGVDERFFRARPLSDERRQALGLPESYLLTVGTLEPRKNHLGLFRAIDLLAGRVDLPLVVAGRTGWAFEEILAASHRLESAGNVIRLDYVADEDLPSLYAGSAAVIYPAWYEGFGLPVLEAMATGVPVVTSTAPSLVDVGGDTILTADATRPDALADAIEQALRCVARSEPFRQARIARARTFRWEDSGRILARTLRELAEGAGR
jgi:glycosyltransferase involved in cell wall biosynthesis